MAKQNPNRQELIDFIHQTIPQLDVKIMKIEDFSSGVHYLYLLSKIYPDVVKLTKINMKAMHEHENIVNLKLLATYLSQLKAPFSFEVSKVAQRNYQENLNLLKNLYKYYYFSTVQKRQASRDVSIDRKTSLGQKKPQPKIRFKIPPPVANKPPVQIKKTPASSQGLKNVVKPSKQTEEQLKRILVVVNNQEQNAINQAAEEKLNKIKRILGLQVPNSSKRKQKEQNNYQTICSGSKTIMKQDQGFKSGNRITFAANQSSKTQIKLQENKKQDNPEHQTQSKRQEKQFDCGQIKQSMLKRYELRPTSYRKSFGGDRISKDNFPAWVKEQDQEDTRFNQNLLSPQPDIGENKNTTRQSSRRKSIMRSSGSLSVEKNKNVSENKKRVHFSAQKILEVKEDGSSKKPSKQKEVSSKKQLSNQKNQVLEISVSKNISDVKNISDRKDISERKNIFVNQSYSTTRNFTSNTKAQEKQPLSSNTDIQI